MAEVLHTEYHSGSMSYGRCTACEAEARSLTNVQLANAVHTISYSPRRITKHVRKAVLYEATRRLTWPDAYENHLA